MFGPYLHAHTTYGDHIKLGRIDLNETDELYDELYVVDGLVWYNGFWYGDWSVFDAQAFVDFPDLLKRLVPFDVLLRQPKVDERFWCPPSADPLAGSVIPKEE